MANPYAIVDPPKREILPNGLFSVIDFRNPGSDRWEMGVQWQSLPCEPEITKEQGPCDEVILSFDAEQTLGTAEPFTVKVQVKCNPMGRVGDIARDALVAAEQYAAEKELWDRLDAAAPKTPVATFDNGDLSALMHSVEDWISNNYGGSQGVVHVPRSVALRAGFSNDNGVLRLPFGTPVVAGGGYGTEGAGQNFVFVTPAMLGYRSDIYEPAVVPQVRTNDFYQVAARDYLIGWDPCPVARFLVNIPA